MRRDLNKLLCEEERNGSSRSYKEVRNKKDFRIIDEDFSAGRESMTKRYMIAGINKEFGEHLNPLYGIVRKNVGRRWDDVYSELCEVFDFRSHINAHILVHLWDYVERDTFWKDGKVWVNSRYSGAKLLDETYSEYYVHPLNGILSKNQKFKTWNERSRERKAEREAEARKTCIVISKSLELRRRDEDSPWFICELAFLAYPKKIIKEYTSRIGKRSTQYEAYPDCDAIDCWTREKVKWGSYYCTSYRSAGKKDLKSAGLKD